MRFETQLDVPPVEGRLQYVRTEGSIDFATRLSAGGQEDDARVASLAVGTLQIEVDLASGAFRYPWGYHPHQRWRRVALPPLVLRPAAIRVLTTQALQEGCSYDVPEALAWHTFFDERTGWLAITRSPPAANVLEAFQFATSSAVMIDGTQLQGLWLRHSLVDIR